MDGHNCENCSKTFTRKSSLKRHVEHVHDEMFTRLYRRIMINPTKLENVDVVAHFKTDKKQKKIPNARIVNSICRYLLLRWAPEASSDLREWGYLYFRVY